jgi:hypothetical protein
MFSASSDNKIRSTHTRDNRQQTTHVNHNTYQSQTNHSILLSIGIHTDDLKMTTDHSKDNAETPGTLRNSRASAVSIFIRSYYIPQVARDITIFTCFYGFKVYNEILSYLISFLS